MTFRVGPRSLSAFLAVLVVLCLGAGTGSAVAGRLVTGRDIKDASITNADIKPGTLTSTALSPSLLATTTGTTDVNGQAGTPALAEVVQWTLSAGVTQRTEEYPGWWMPVGEASTDTLPTNSRVTFINADVDVDTTSCSGQFRLYFYALDPVTHQQFGIGGWGQLGPDYEESPEWDFGYVGSDMGTMALLTGDHPYNLAALGACFSEVPGESAIMLDIPAFTATVVFLVESLPDKPERILE